MRKKKYRNDLRDIPTVIKMKKKYRDKDIDIHKNEKEIQRQRYRQIYLKMRKKKYRAKEIQTYIKIAVTNITKLFWRYKYTIGLGCLLHKIMWQSLL